jgi:class 3 adenylate cyclase
MASELRTPFVSDDTRVLVIFFDDIRGSMALKEHFVQVANESAFQAVRNEHDELVSSIIVRDGGGEVIKSTGDGFLAVFHKPSLAVERCMEIQERLRGHPLLSVRIGLDMGEVRVELEDGRIRDVFGRHVDWAARVAGMADGGHVCVTKSVYTDAVSWAGLGRIAWKEHGRYRVKPDEPPLDVFEAFNANALPAMDHLHGDLVDGPTPGLPSAAPRRTGPQVAEATVPGLRLVKPWEAVARDGREFAENGAGMMYWFKVPLGGISYPEGFRSFLAPALANPRVAKIRFILDSSVPSKRRVWEELVLPQVTGWAQEHALAATPEISDDGGRLVLATEPPTVLAWVFDDLSAEFTPSFKFFVDDPDADEPTEQDAQIFIATASRKLRFADGSLNTTRVPDAVIRVRERDEKALLHALNLVANQWDSLFD